MLLTRVTHYISHRHALVCTCAYAYNVHGYVHTSQGYKSITASPCYPLQCFHVAFNHIDLYSDTGPTHTYNGSTNKMACKYGCVRGYYKIRTECLSVKSASAFLMISPFGCVGSWSLLWLLLAVSALMFAGRAAIRRRPFTELLSNVDLPTYSSR